MSEGLGPIKRNSTNGYNQAVTSVDKMVKQTVENEEKYEEYWRRTQQPVGCESNESK